MQRRPPGHQLVSSQRRSGALPGRLHGARNVSRDLVVLNRLGQSDAQEGMAVFAPPGRQSAACEIGSSLRGVEMTHKLTHSGFRDRRHGAQVFAVGSIVSLG